MALDFIPSRRYSKHMVNKRAQETKNKILKAASDVVMVDGIGNLTLEAVAKRAGISKGGLLYHYGSKEDLVKGMIEYSISSFNNRLERKLKTEPNWLKSYIETSFEQNEVEDSASASLLAAIVINPALLDPLRENYKLWQAQLDDSVGQPTSLIARLVIDGLWISHLLNMPLPEEESLQELKQYLINLTEDDK